MRVIPAENGNPLIFLGILLLLIAMLLTLISIQRIDSFYSHHSTLAEHTVDIVSHEILQHMDEKHRLLTLFADYEADGLTALANKPSDQALLNKQTEKLFKYFPDAFVFTLANPLGEPLFNHNNSSIDIRVEHEIFDYSAGEMHLPQIHPHPKTSFYDVMVRTKAPMEYILFVGFKTDILVELLKKSSQPKHEIFLINTKQESLIEITVEGGREVYGDKDTIFLTPDKIERTLAEKAIPNTYWRLVDIAGEGLFSNFRIEVFKQSASVFLVFLFSSIALAWFTIRQKHHRNSAEAELMAAKGRLEYEIEERTQELRQSRGLAEITLSSISDGVITTDAKGIVTAINMTAQELIGQQQSEAVGKPLSAALKLSDISTESNFIFPLAPRLNQDEFQYLNNSPYHLERNDNKERIVQLSISEITSNNHSVVGNVLVIRDITESHHMTHQISWQATHDTLTGLINRVEFESRLSDALELSRADRTSHALMYLDLDQFKVVNDTCGHIAGDELLKQISKLLEKTIRRNDTVARLGGDEFAILLQSCPIERLTILAEELRNVIRDYRFTWNDKPFSIGASIGIVSFNDSFSSVTQILSAADSACYAAKDAGRNRVHLYAEDDKAIKQRFGEMRWVSLLREALDSDKFELYGQRISPLHKNSIEDDHIEILLRLRNSNGTIILPGAFIPAAERYGMMIEIDRMVIEKTLAWLQESHYAGTISVNLSAQSMTDPNFLDEVFNMLCNTLTHPGQILFEVTETTAITHLQIAQAFISRIRELGCRFALDDFGSGMSSFGYLKHLPVDHLKIDGSFIEDIVEDPVNYAMVKAIQEVASTMKIKTVAEYIENEDILDHLRIIGIDYGQGYAIEAPKPLNAFHPGYNSSTQPSLDSSI
jgi:diguanylate cyclase (GGDEF)-like protein/PAS domain S-box-containing protein